MNEPSALEREDAQADPPRIVFDGVGGGGDETLPQPLLSQRLEEVGPTNDGELPVRLAATTTSITSADSSLRPTTTLASESPTLVIPSEDKDVASKRKLAGITYFADNRKQSTMLVEQKQKLKIRGAGTTSNGNDSVGPEGVATEKEDVKVGAFPSNKPAKQLENERSSKSYLAALTPSDPQGDDSADSNKMQPPKSYLEALTPSDQQQVKDIKGKEKDMRPSYLGALESGSFSSRNGDDPMENLLDSIAPLPSPQPIQPSQPGAHSFSQHPQQPHNPRRSIVIGYDGEHPSSHLVGDETVVPPDLAQLAVALAVHEEDVDSLSVATPDKTASSFRTKEDRDKETKSFLVQIGIGAVVVLAAFFLGLGLALGLDLGKKQPDPMASPTPTTSAPTTITEDPTPKEILLLEELLPDFSMASIQSNPDSPQAKSYDWILEELSDGSYLDITSDPDRILQRFALTTFYYATKGDEWLDNDGWLDHSLHECLWFAKPWWSHIFTGLPPERFTYNDNPNSCEWNTLSPNVTFEGHQTYRHFWLYENGLQGSIPPELGLLTGLVSIYLYNNSYSGPIPSQIGLVNKPRVLNMAMNQLTGTLPTQLGALYTLKEISFFGAGLRGTIPLELGKLTLETLRIHDNLLSGTIPSMIGEMSTLRHVWLSQNNFSGPIPSEIGGASKLSSLSIFGNSLTGSIPSQIFSLNKLYFLWMQDNQLTGNLPSEIGQFSSTLDFQFGNNQLSGSLPSELGLCTNTIRLDMHNNQLQGSIPSELGLLPSLSLLYLYENQLTGKIPAELPSVTYVTPLLWERYSSDPPTWQQAWREDLSPVPGLIFAVQSNQLSGTIPANFSLMENLTAVQLTNNPLLSGTVPDDLCELKIWSLFEEVVAFDCTDLLCGCNCTCSVAAP